MRALDKIADEFETAPTLAAAVPAPLEDEDTKPGWLRTPPRPRLAANHRRMIRQLVTYVGTMDAGRRPGAVARAMRTILRTFSTPELRDAALQCLADEAVHWDEKDGE